MSIFSSIGNAIKSAATYTYNTVNSIGSGIANAFSGGSSQSANALNFNNPTNNTLQASRASTPAYGTPAYYSSSPTYTAATGGINTSQGGAGLGSYGPTLPVTINSGQQKVSGGMTPVPTGGGYSGGGGSSIPSFAMASPTIGTASLGPTTLSRSSSGTSSGLTAPTYGGGSTGSQPITLAGAPTSTNPGSLNTTGLAGTLAGLYKRNADGTYEQVPNTTQPVSDQQTADKAKTLYDQIFANEKTVGQDPGVIATQQQRQQIQQSLLAPTQELNAVIAKQNQDLLQLRQTGSQEGVTEAVYGGQSNAINYNAAIRALPLQASIAGLQGDLKLAQDYLSELTQTKTEQIKQQHDYNVGLYNAISGALETKDKRAYEEGRAEITRQANVEQDLVDYKAEISAKVLQNSGGKLPQNILTRINDSKDKVGVAQAAGQYLSTPNTEIRQLDNGQTVVIDKNTGKVVSNLGGAKPTESPLQPGDNPQLYSGLKPSTAIAVRSVVSKYSSEPTIQNFATVQDGYNFAKSIKADTKNPADDQALIYSLAKTLDPNSVVREGEYATAQKYSQSWINAYGKGVTQAIAGTGFLSQTARENIKKTIESKYNSAKTSYNNQYKEYTGQINNLTGRSDGGKFIRSYVTGTSPGGSADPLGIL